MTSQEQKELLLRVVTKLAATQLQQGGFIPFGAVLGPGRSVKLLMPKGWKQDATRDELENYWAAELREASKEVGCSTVCSCADVRVPAGGGGFIAGLLIHIEQAEQSAEDILYPYQKDRSNQVIFGPPTSVPTDPQIFPYLQKR